MRASSHGTIRSVSMPERALHAAGGAVEGFVIARVAAVWPHIQDDVWANLLTHAALVTVTRERAAMAIGIAMLTAATWWWFRTRNPGGRWSSVLVIISAVYGTALWACLPIFFTLDPGWWALSFAGIGLGLGLLFLPGRFTGQGQGGVPLLLHLVSLSALSFALSGSLALPPVFACAPGSARPGCAPITPTASALPPTETSPSAAPTETPELTSTLPPSPTFAASQTPLAMPSPTPTDLPECEGLPLPLGMPPDTFFLHTVKERETIISIAKLYDVDPVELVLANVEYYPSLHHPGGYAWDGVDCIFPGWVLVIPGRAPLPSPAPAGQAAPALANISTASALLAPLEPSADTSLSMALAVLCILAALPLLALVMLLRLPRR